MTVPQVTPDALLVTDKEPASIRVPVTDLNRRPDGPRDRQLLYGDAVTVLRSTGDWCYIQAEKDGYCGHVRDSTVGAAQVPTHRVNAPATHAYQAADLKSPDLVSLSFGSRVVVTDQANGFARTPLGFIPVQHLLPVDSTATDPAAIAALFIGTPYLWGGNSVWGIDCSGLIQAALHACGLPCPGDSDQQAALGDPVGDGTYRRNDLLFWKGHVAMVVDTETVIHANAGTMSTRYEGIDAAIERIRSAGDGDITAHRRL